MRRKHVFALASVVAVSGAAAAYADHAVPLDPATVPQGVFVSHNRVSNISTAALVQATRRNRADVTIQHARLEPNQASAWHEHPGPGLVTVVRGSLTLEYAAGGECREVFYPAGRGFMDRREAHRVVAGDEGADIYIVFIHPRGAGNPFIVGTEPEECAE